MRVLQSVLAFVGLSLALSTPVMAKPHSADPPAVFDDSYCDFLNSLAVSPGFVPPQSANAARLKRVKAGASDELDGARLFVLNALTSIPAYEYNLWNLSSEVLEITLDGIKNNPCTVNASLGAFEYHPFTPQMEGPVSAPRSHNVVFKNELVRVIHWTLPCGYREEYHTHGLPSIMWKIIRASTSYYDWNGPNPISTSAPVDPANPGPIQIDFMSPEFIHSIINNQQHTYHVIRIEFTPTNGTAADYHWPETDILG